MTTKNGVITGLDFAKALGCRSMAERYEKITRRIINQGVPIDTPFINTRPTGKVYAEIEFGRWVVKCTECNGQEIVEPDEPIFYCLSCGNRENQGKPKKVIFPEEINRIERQVMRRPVDDSYGRNKMERAFNAKPLVFDLVDGELRPLSRTWLPQETLRDLRQQNEILIDSFDEEE